MDVVIKWYWVELEKRKKVFRYILNKGKELSEDHQGLVIKSRNLELKITEFEKSVLERNWFFSFNVFYTKTVSFVIEWGFFCIVVQYFGKFSWVLPAAVKMLFQSNKPLIDAMSLLSLNFNFVDKSLWAKNICWIGMGKLTKLCQNMEVEVLISTAVNKYDVA